MVNIILMLDASEIPKRYLVAQVASFLLSSYISVCHGNYVWHKDIAIYAPPIQCIGPVGRFLRFLISLM